MEPGWGAQEEGDSLKEASSASLTTSEQPWGIQKESERVAGAPSRVGKDLWQVTSG